MTASLLASSAIEAPCSTSRGKQPAKVKASAHRKKKHVRFITPL